MSKPRQWVEVGEGCVHQSPEEDTRVHKHNVRVWEKEERGEQRKKAGRDDALGGVTFWPGSLSRCVVYLYHACVFVR